MSGLGISGVEATLVQRSAAVQIPHDPATIVVYVLLAVAALVVWYGNRNAKKAEANRDSEENGDLNDSSGTGGGASDGTGTDRHEGASTKR